MFIQQEAIITTITKLSTTETASSKLSTLSITGRISELKQHLHILQTTHTHNNPTVERGTFFQWHVTFQQMHQAKPSTLLRGCPQLTHLNSHHQRCEGYHEEVQPAY